VLLKIKTVKFSLVFKRAAISGLVQCPSFACSHRIYPARNLKIRKVTLCYHAHFALATLQHIARALIKTAHSRFLGSANHSCFQNDEASRVCSNHSCFQNDEAITRLEDTIDQMTLGHLWFIFSKLIPTNAETLQTCRKRFY
jgi:hypothetical protein